MWCEKYLDTVIIFYGIMGANERRTNYERDFVRRCFRIKDMINPYNCLLKNFSIKTNTE